MGGCSCPAETTLLKLKTTPLKTFKKHPKKTFKKRLDKCNFLVYNGYKEKRTNVLFAKNLLNKGFLTY